MWNEIIAWMKVRENVTFLIAVASFGLSVWNFVSDKFRNRKKLEIVVCDVFCLGPSPEQEYTEVLNLNIINKSREAITLSGIEVSAKNQICRFGEYRLKLIVNSQKIGGKEVGRSEWNADVFPIKIEGMGYAHMLLASTGSKKYIQAGEPYKMKLFSNKGTITKVVTSDFSSVARLSQCRAPDSHTEALQ